MILNKIKTVIENRIIRREGGEHLSIYLRKITEERYKVKVGMYSYGCFSPSFNIGGSVVVGRYCSFGPNVRYFGANHPIHQAVMTPFFYNKAWGFDVKDVERNQLVIGHDCWIGNNVTITSTCHCIGNGAVIGAGAVVTEDVPPYAIVVGVPAKCIRYRFTKDVRDILDSSKWWEYEPDELYRYYDYINTPEEWARRIISSQKG